MGLIENHLRLPLLALDAAGGASVIDALATLVHWPASDGGEPGMIETDTLLADLESGAAPRGIAGPRRPWRLAGGHRAAFGDPGLLRPS